MLELEPILSRRKAGWRDEFRRREAVS